jgi:nucleolar protein 14
MTPEDRMLERYTRERELQRLGGSGTGGNKKSLFNLEDDEAFGETDGGNLGLSLTHGGRDVGDLEGDDFERMGMAAGLFDGEDPEEKWKGAIDERTVRRSHFGGFDDDKEDDLPERKKSKQEVMSEIIAKSKEYKVSPSWRMDSPDKAV